MNETVQPPKAPRRLGIQPPQRAYWRGENPDGRAKIELADGTKFLGRGTLTRLSEFAVCNQVAHARALEVLLTSVQPVTLVCHDRASQGLVQFTGTLTGATPNKKQVPGENTFLSVAPTGFAAATATVNLVSESAQGGYASARSLESNANEVAPKLKRAQRRRDLTPALADQLTSVMAQHALGIDPIVSVDLAAHLEHCSRATFYRRRKQRHIDDAAGAHEGLIRYSSLTVAAPINARPRLSGAQQ